MEIEEGCKGCLAYSGCYGPNGPRDLEFIKRCPCKTCLIKGMCLNVCSDFTNIINLCRQRNTN